MDEVKDEHKSLLVELETKKTINGENVVQPEVLEQWCEYNVIKKWKPNKQKEKYKGRGK